MAPQTMTQLRSVKSIINYFPVDGPRKVYPGTAGYQRRNFDSQTVQVSDVRGAEDEFTLESNGFQVFKNTWPETKANFTDQQVKDSVYPETVKVLKQLTGATDVVAFSHQIRCHSAQQVKDLADGLEDSQILKVAGPTQFAHCDNSKEGSLTVLKENVSAAEYEKWQKGRWAIMNVWRPIERAVTREALAILDAQTVHPSDFVGVWVSLPRPGQGAFDNIYNAGEGFEIAQITASDRHRWYYVSNMSTDETLVFKQFDSKMDGRARQTPHCAFQCADDHGPTRQSIEVRCLVFWEGESVE